MKYFCGIENILLTYFMSWKNSLHCIELSGRLRSIFVCELVDLRDYGCNNFEVKILQLQSRSVKSFDRFEAEVQFLQQYLRK